jgi:nitronate monooxygenase
MASPSSTSSLKTAYPWIKLPLITSAPMRLISNAALATTVSLAHGIGFIGAGSDISSLSEELSKARDLLSTSPTLQTKYNDTLPIGIGFLLWGAPLTETLTILSKPENTPAAVWLFAPQTSSQLKEWSQGIRTVTSQKTKIWIQVTSVHEALEATKTASPDVLVIQGTDAGGHGAAQGAGITSLVPETIDAVTSLCNNNPSIPLPAFIATGGISDGRAIASALALGAQGTCLGTRFLAAHESAIAPGYRNAVIAISDGGRTTIRSSVYDTLRGTTSWPSGYGGRGVLNASFRDHQAGMADEDNKRLYEEAVASGGDEGWEGERARLTTYAGTGVGLVKRVESARDITVGLRGEAKGVLRRLADLASTM